MKKTIAVALTLVASGNVYAGHVFGNGFQDVSGQYADTKDDMQIALRYDF